jgi:hypothetical protein
VRQVVGARIPESANCAVEGSGRNLLEVDHLGLVLLIPRLV